MPERRSQRLSEEATRLRAQLREARLVMARELEAYRAELDIAADELRAANAQLESSRDRYVELYDLAPVGYVTLDRNGVVIELNLPACALLADVRERIVGHPLLGYLAPGSRAEFLEHMRRCRSGPGPVTTQVHLLHAGGATIPIELTSRAGRDTSPGRYHTILVDLSERQRTAEALRRSERLAGLGTLTAGVAHELKNPLHAILLTAEFLQKNLEPRLGTEQLDLLAGIVEDVHRCNRIIRNMLSFARDEATEKWPADLNAIVRRAVGVARSYGFKCQMQLQLAPEPLWIRANPTEIEQVLINLAKNAVESHTEGECRIQFESLLNGERARLEVSDNGPGIPTEHLPHVFEPFFTTRRGRGGTGLGLSVVHAIVTEHGGTIDVENDRPQGTRFVAEFPLIQPRERARGS